MGENGVKPPKALGQHRKALKSATAVFRNHLKTTDMNEALLNTDNKEKFKSKVVKNREDESMHSSNSTTKDEDADTTRKEQAKSAKYTRKENINEIIRTSKVKLLFEKIWHVS